MNLAWRILLALVVLPGVVALFVPAIVIVIEKPNPPARAYWLGLLPAAVGSVILFACVRSFALEGRGTLAPWDPPRRLVTRGLFRWVRNPMYLGVLLLLAGWAICCRSVALAIYGCAMAIGFHLRVVLVEEPRLRRQFKDEFEEYSKRVPRWVPRIPHDQ